MSVGEYLTVVSLMNRCYH